MDFTTQIAQKLQLPAPAVASTLQLIAEGDTVPFIARYRKEATGNLDEVQIANIRDRQEELKQLEDRRSSIIKSLQEQKVYSDTLKSQIEKADTLVTLEDLYLPYKPKRKTKASIAKEKGLEPLADILWEYQCSDAQVAAAQYVDASKEVNSVDEALQGARDILAERISDDASARSALRQLFEKQATLKSTLISGKEEEGAKYRDYFKWEEPIQQIPSHRLLAIRRGEKEGFLYHRILPNEDDCLQVLTTLFVQAAHPLAEQMHLVVKDAWKRLLMTSLETEARLASKKKADQGAIHVFAENLEELLMAAPLGAKRILAMDPGFRTGCKIVVLDEQGNLLHHHVIYVTQSTAQLQQAQEIVLGLVQQFKIQAIAIGNGTASRETESFVRALKLPSEVAVVVVNESGASIYSASEVARQEFPDQDITVRGSVSIGRRLMDPLAELVKIDPKSIGVGQYQHDVDQRSLQKSLDDVVIRCVNRVGVDLNTASTQLLSYVAGLNKNIAEQIITYRKENGSFRSRQDLQKVPRLGPKAFEQCAGFLRIADAAHPLDSSAVHPERYALVEQMAQDLGCSVIQLMEDSTLHTHIKLSTYVSQEVGLPTLQDILQELAKPGRDPRRQFETFRFQEGVESMADLRVGMKLPGLVTNVTAFGAFVDIGVHQDGLVHISQLADKFISNAAEVVKVQQKVQVTVTEVDLQRQRIALSMRSDPELATSPNAKKDQRSSPRSSGQKSQGQNKQRRPKPQSASLGNDWFAEALNKNKSR